MPFELLRCCAWVDDHGASACARVAPGVGCIVVNRIGRCLRRIDQDVSGQNPVDERSVGQVVALIVMHNRTEIGVRITNIDSGGIATER